MKQVNLGSQGLRVPTIGLGCMGMSDFYGSSSESQNLRVLDRAAEIGCTFWDTSDMYGMASISRCRDTRDTKN
jgi:aryl-alcohol dehydrogenase-like predicted oxidoreductase